LRVLGGGKFRLNDWKPGPDRFRSLEVYNNS
jgi:hypothetical protein